MSEVLKKDHIYKELRDAIRSGKISSGEKLPGEMQLTQVYNVSRVTVRGALQMLEQDKLIVKINGRGTFVAHNTSGVRYLAISPDSADITNPMQYILPGIEKQLAQTGIKLEICSKHFIRGIDSKKADSLFKKHLIRGIFLLDNLFTGNEPEIDMLNNAGLPVVLPHAYPQDRDVLNFAMMIADFRLAFGDGVRELARQGHKRIGTIFAADILIDTVECRGFKPTEYLEFLKLNGFDASPELVKRVAYSYESISGAVEELMLGSSPPTAIACFSDFYAIRVYEALKKLRIHIPEQVSVMGFCGYPGGQFMSPPLSTVDLMYENAGRMAANLMLKSDEWYGQDKPLTVFTPHRVITRESMQSQIDKFSAVS